MNFLFYFISEGMSTHDEIKREKILHILLYSYSLQAYSSHPQMSPTKYMMQSSPKGGEKAGFSPAT